MVVLKRYTFCKNSGCLNLEMTDAGDDSRSFHPLAPPLPVNDIRNLQPHDVESLIVQEISDDSLPSASVVFLPVSQQPNPESPPAPVEELVSEFDLDSILQELEPMLEESETSEEEPEPIDEEVQTQEATPQPEPQLGGSCEEKSEDIFDRFLAKMSKTVPTLIKYITETEFDNQCLRCPEVEAVKSFRLMSLPTFINFLTESEDTCPTKCVKEELIQKSCSAPELNAQSEMKTLPDIAPVQMSEDTPTELEKMLRPESEWSLGMEARVEAEEPLEFRPATDSKESVEPDDIDVAMAQETYADSEPAISEYLPPSEEVMTDIFEPSDSDIQEAEAMKDIFAPSEGDVSGEELQSAIEPAELDEKVAPKPTLDDDDLIPEEAAPEEAAPEEAAPEEAAPEEAAPEEPQPEEVPPELEPVLKESEIDEGAPLELELFIEESASEDAGPVEKTAEEIIEVDDALPERFPILIDDVLEPELEQDVDPVPQPELINEDVPEVYEVEELVLADSADEGEEEEEEELDGVALE